MVINFGAPPPHFPIPHPPVSVTTYLVVEDAIRLAWARLRQSEFDIEAADEDTITQRLHEVLVDEVYNSGQIEGFDDAVFHMPVRESKYRNFNGDHLDKIPDMHVGIIGRQFVRRSQDGIFIECKPVDATHTAGAHYCNRGIVRFVNGSYGWAMTSAMMIGYAATGYTIDPKLSDALAASTSIVTAQMPEPCELSRPVLYGEKTQTSIHERKFAYVENGSLAPDVTLRHVWLSC